MFSVSLVKTAARCVFFANFITISHSNFQLIYPKLVEIKRLSKVSKELHTDIKTLLREKPYSEWVAVGQDKDAQPLRI